MKSEKPTGNTCFGCGAEFKNTQARRAHQKHCKKPRWKKPEPAIGSPMAAADGSPMAELRRTDDQPTGRTGQNPNPDGELPDGAPDGRLCHLPSSSPPGSGSTGSERKADGSRPEAPDNDPTAPPVDPFAELQRKVNFLKVNVNFVKKGFERRLLAGIEYKVDNRTRLTPQQEEMFGELYFVVELHVRERRAEWNRYQDEMNQGLHHLGPQGHDVKRCGICAREREWLNRPAPSELKPGEVRPPGYDERNDGAYCWLKDVGAHQWGTLKSICRGCNA